MQYLFDLFHVYNFNFEPPSYLDRSTSTPTWKLSKNKTGHGNWQLSQEKDESNKIILSKVAIKEQEVMNQNVTIPEIKT